MSLLNCIFRANFLFSIDYNEGWNVFYTQRILNHQHLYTTHYPYITNNYPPFSFYITAYLSKINSNILLTGRYISILSVIVISICIFLAVRKSTDKLHTSIFSGLFCLGLFSISANHYVGMNDPQLMGNALSALALLLYLTNKSRYLSIVVILLTLSVFIKHSLIILPVALLLDMLLNKNKNVILYILFGIGSTALSIALIFLLSEQQFLIQILDLETSRQFSLNQAISQSAHELFWILPTLILALFFLIKNRNKEIFRTILIYLICALFFGLYFTGGAGVDVNVFFDLFISLSIAVGLALHDVHALNYSLNIKNQLKWVLPLIFCLGLVIQARHAVIFPNLFKYYTQRETDFISDCDLLTTKDGTLLSENILLCLYSNKAFTFDAFNVSQLIKSGKISEKDLIALIENGTYSLIQLDKPIDDSSISEGRMSPKMLNAIIHHYQQFHSSLSGCFYEYKK